MLYTESRTTEQNMGDCLNRPRDKPPRMGVGLVVKEWVQGLLGKALPTLMSDDISYFRYTSDHFTIGLYFA